MDSFDLPKAEYWAKLSVQHQLGAFVQFSIFKRRHTLLEYISSPDERNRNYPVSAMLEELTVDGDLPELRPISKHWDCPIMLNQGSSSACTGFSTVQEIVSDPVSTVMTKAEGEALAYECYRWAQHNDEWAGEAYKGSSVNAAMKWALKGGYISSYHWAFDINDLILAIGHKGPAVLGIGWYEGMAKPKGGFIRPTGRNTGGHAILCNGYNHETEVFTLHNSWGRWWGRKAECYITKSHLELLLSDGGVAAIPTGRKTLK